MLPDTNERFLDDISYIFLITQQPKSKTIGVRLIRFYKYSKSIRVTLYASNQYVTIKFSYK